MNNYNKERYIKCTRCRKVLYRENAFWIKGEPYGPECAQILLEEIEIRRIGSDEQEIKRSEDN